MYRVFTAAAFAALSFVSTAAAQPAAPAPDIAGSWATTFGDTYFNVQERRNAQGRVIAQDVVAPYKGEAGTLRGELRGPVLSGYWSEPSSAQRCATARDGTNHWGRFSFTFDPAAESFQGRWGYCDQAPSRAWTGRRTALAAAPDRPAPATGAQNQRRAANMAPAGAAAPAGGCGAPAQQQPPSAGRAILGALGRAAGGAILDRGLSRMGVPYSYGLRSTVYNGLMDGIACLLSPRERQQAVQATQEVVTKGVGARREWRSADRPGVTGSSTVTAESTRANGALCRTVSDVVIVDGEETTVQKQMCRNPGQTGFVLAA